MSQCRSILYSLGDGVISINSSGHLTYLNPMAHRLLHESSEQAIGKHWQQLFNLIDPLTGDAEPDPFAICTQIHETIVLPEPTVLVCADGSQFHVGGSVSAMPAAQYQQPDTVMVFRDSSEASALLARTSYEASHDMLTRLYNRHAFEQRLLQLLERTDSNNQHSLLLLDMCKFKQINDRFGHAVGDVALCQVADLLKSLVRERDIVARYGGDEFAILMEHCQAEQALQTANDINSGMQRYHFQHSDRHGCLSVSIGITTMERKNLSMMEVMRTADVACYAAKQNGNQPHLIGIRDTN